MVKDCELCANRQKNRNTMEPCRTCLMESNYLKMPDSYLPRFKHLAEQETPCPKCGSEMMPSFDQPIYPEGSDEPSAWIYNYHCYNCGGNRSEKVNCGHEQKVDQMPSEENKCQNGVVEGQIHSICIICDLECPFLIWQGTPPKCPDCGGERILSFKSNVPITGPRNVWWCAVCDREEEVK